MKPNELKTTKPKRKKDSLKKQTSKLNLEPLKKSY